MLALGGIALTAAPASAAPLSVDTTADSGIGSLRQAITDANLDPDADVITITATGTLALESNLPPINQPVQIVGPAGGFIVDGQGSWNTLNIFGSPGLDVTISDLSLVNSSGNGIYASAAGLTLTRVTIDDSALYGYYALGGTSALTDVTVEGSANNNIELLLSNPAQSATFTDVTSRSSDFAGLGADLTSGAQLTITGSAFSNNGSVGAFVSADSSTVHIDDSVFEDNNTADVSSSGGGLYAYAVESALMIEDSVFSGNGADDGGGLGIEEHDSDIALHRLTVVDNSAGEDGGGIYLDSPGDDDDFGGVRILRTTLDDNSAGERGGGIASDMMWPTGSEDVPGLLLQDSTVSDNTSEGSGGGIAISSSIVVDDDLPSPVYVIANSTFSANSSEEGAGRSMPAATTSASRCRSGSTCSPRP
jgi:hypothetical protein